MPGFDSDHGKPAQRPRNRSRNSCHSPNYNLSYQLLWPTLATTGTALLVVSQPGGDEEQHADIVRDGTVWRRRTRSRVPYAQECSLVVPLEFAGKRPILASRMSSRAPAIEVKCQRERKLKPTGKTLHVEQRSSGCARSACLWPLAAWPFSFIRVRCFAGLKVMIFRKL